MTCVGFLTGFVAVLCIGNYYRAKRAMERQRQRRLARLSGHAGNGVVGLDSPGSNVPAKIRGNNSNINDNNSNGTNSDTMGSERQDLLSIDGVSTVSSKEQTARRRNQNDTLESLTLFVDETAPRAQITNV